MSDSKCPICGFSYGIYSYQTKVVATVIETGEKEEMCHRCFIHRNGFTCGDCGEVFIGQHFYDNDDEPYCEPCYANFLKTYDYRTAIQSYCFKPIPQFFKTEEDDDDLKTFFGVELEVDTGNDRERGYYDEYDEWVEYENLNEELHSTVRKILDANEEVYIKEDGSLEDGFEIVSHPCSLNYHLKSELWKNIRKSLLPTEFRSHSSNTCGLHIHVSRDAFNDELAISKAIIFVEKHYETILKFSRRRRVDMENWAKRYFVTSTKFVVDEKANIETKVEEYKKNDASHYKIVNIQNAKTIEFRMFRGSLNVNTIKASLQLVDAIVKISNTYSLDDILELNFLDYKEIHKGENLKKYLIKRKIVKERKEEGAE